MLAQSHAPVTDPVVITTHSWTEPFSYFHTESTDKFMFAGFIVTDDKH
jgi:hypothetical protein